MSADLIFFTLIMGLIFFRVIVALIQSICIVPAQTEFVIERLGKYYGTLKAGFHLLIPFLDIVSFKQNLKERTIDVPPQSCFTKDEIQVEVDGVIYMQVFDSERASYGITDYGFAAVQLAQTTTRAIIGTLELDRTFEERETISGKVVNVLDEVANKWGVRILRFEIKNLIPPESVRNSMEKQVTAERDRRAILQQSIGQKQSLINTSEGMKAQLVNISEGEKLKQINEAEGKAEEILRLGEATATSIRKIAAAISAKGGAAALKLELGEKYFTALENLGSEKNNVILSGELTNLDELLKDMGLNI